MMLRESQAHGVAIVARDLVKSYGETEAVRGVSFEVRAGEVVGFLGPNGAGKTTTVRMISCFLPPTSGSAEVFGIDVRTRPRAVKAMLGICPQEDNLDPDFDVLKNLLVYARYFDIPPDVARKRALELLDAVSLGDRLKSRVDALSGGMKRRLVLARALVNEPRVLILDEPTTGLDPQARHSIWTRVRSLRATGVTVLLTTHYMEEASQLCDRVILVDDGKVLLDGAPKDLIEREIGHTVIEAWNHGAEFAAAARALPGRVEEIGDRLFFYPGDAEGAERFFDERFPDQERPKVWRRNIDVFLVTLPIEGLPAIVEPILYLLAFGMGLGTMIGTLHYQGRVVDYLHFLAPGTVAVAILFWSYFEMTYASYIRMYYQKTFDAILATPLLVEDVILGEMIFAATKSLLAATVMLAVIAAFGLVSWPTGLLVLPIAVLGGFFFAGVGMVITSMVTNISHFNVPMSLFVLPMFTFGGTFFPLEVLPSWAHPIAWCLPLTHVSLLVRSATLGMAHPMIPVSLAYLGLGAVVFGLLALHRMKRRLVP